MGTPSAALNPLQQDFTRLSANGCLKGKTGVGVWRVTTHSGVHPVSAVPADAPPTGEGGSSAGCGVPPQ
eukprot:4542657-Lingulodinium_polyedra.AAC.1